MYGPMQFSVVGFDNNEVLPGVLDELDRLRESGTVRLVDMLIVSKDKYGNLFTLEVSDFSDEERMEMGALIGALIGLGAGGTEGAKVGADAGAYAVAENDFGLLGDDLKEVISDIPDGTSAIVVLFEHTWAKRIREYAYNNGGFLVAQGLLHPEAFVEYGAHLAEAVERAELEEAKQEEVKASKSSKGTSTKEIKDKKKTKKS